MNNFGISILWVEQCGPRGEISLQLLKRQVHRVASGESVNLIQKILDRDVFQVRIGDIMLAVWVRTISKDAQLINMGENYLQMRAFWSNISTNSKLNGAYK